MREKLATFIQAAAAVLWCGAALAFFLFQLVVTLALAGAIAWAVIT